MSAFTDEEIAYLNAHRLGRLATISATGELHVVPASYIYNAELETIDVGGWNMSRSKKFRDAHGRQVAFVVDDTEIPRHPRGLEIRGKGESLRLREDDSPEFGAAIIRIHPARIVSWGIESSPYQPNSHLVR